MIGDHFMNSRTRFLMLVGALSLTLGLRGAQGSILGGSLINGINNTLQDQSAEQVFDQNGNGLFDTGDVVAGFIRLDNNITNAGFPYSNQVYAVFSQQVQSVVRTPFLGGTSIYS